MPGFDLGLALGRRPGLAAPVFDFSGGALPAGAALTRASAGRHWGADGALVSAAADVARFDRDPASGALRGLLIEPAATNVLPWSGGIDGFGERSGCTVTGGFAGAPDGSAGWGRIAPTVGDGVFPYVADTSFAKSAAATYTLSLFVGRETLRWALLSGDLYGGERYAWFDLLTGVVGTRGGNASAATITPAGPDCWRIAVTFTGTTSPYCLLAPLKSDASFGASFASGDTILAWGAMLETGGRATSPVATSGAAATRAADVLTLDWASRGVADGTIGVRFTFDDGSTQDVTATVAGGVATVPTALNRPWLRRAEKI